MGDRHQFRADWHDYNSGIYFVTICSHEKKYIFGRIVNGTMIFSDWGRIVEACLINIPSHAKATEVWNYVVMPNHVHMVLSVGTRHAASASNSSNIGCLKPPRHGEPCACNHHNSQLAVIVGSFKAAVSKKIHEMTSRTRHAASLPPDDMNTTDGDTSFRIWQSRFHEHIIRDQRAFDNIMNYVDNNVERWADDCFNKKN